MAEDESGGEQPIVIKKIVKGGGAHGGAWKVAYADFVTAMMAFFLLMWLLNATTEEQKNALSEYFDPTVAKVSESTSGAGGVMGGTSLSVEGARTSERSAIAPANNPETSALNAAQAKLEGEDVVKEAEDEIKSEEEDTLNDIKKAIEQAVQQTPALRDLAENLIVEMTPEGLRIQVVDAEGKAMFPSGSARMYQKTKTLMESVAKIIKDVPNKVSIRGHTDSIPYGKGANYTNWDLSSDRANASRRALQESGVAKDRVRSVIGKADTEHLLPDEPTNAKNRRISIILLKEEITDPEALKKKAEARAKAKAQKAAKTNASTTQTEAPPLPSTDTLPKTPLDNGAPFSYTPSLPTPESQDFERTDGNVVFP